jgi:formamidopyrimidine-DNA glycosylase
MPELPEVETVLQGIQPHVKNQVIRSIIIRQSKLRWDIPKEIKKAVENQKVIEISRRGKYLLFHLKSGTAILHFGMSGSLKLMTKSKPPAAHDHFDLVFDNFYLRYTDPRRFGCLLFTQENPEQHPLLASLGPEPLNEEFNGDYLFTMAKNRKVSIKQFIMNHKIVVGVGNIYAAESLFLAKIQPIKSLKPNTKNWSRL